MEIFANSNFRSVTALIVLVFAALSSSRILASEAQTSLEQIERLRAEIEYHDTLYFRDAAPEITDYEYDLLKLELQRLEAGMTPSKSAIGDDRSTRGDQVAHGRPMLSLSKAYSDDEVTTFFDQVAEVASEGVVTFSLELKFDGVAVSVVMDRGQYISAATRGNGASGENITAQIGAVRSLNYEWGFDSTRPRIERIELRGEVYLSHQAFDVLNEDRIAAGDEPFRHPRSVAAGSVKLENLTTVAGRGLSLVFHGWGEVHPATAEPETIMDFRRWLEARGLPSVAQARFLPTENATELNEAVAVLQATLSDYPTDGIVIKVDSVALQRELGVGPTAPRWALARKFAPPRAEAVLRDIVWQVGRTGTLTPVAEFDPVVLGGATIRRASLSNAREIERRDLRIGDTVWVEKAGEIIPQIAGVLFDQRGAEVVPYRPPTICPSCAKTLEQVGENNQLVCGNYGCEDQVVQRLLHFGSKDGLHIRGIGPAMARRLVSSGLVRGPDDLYGLSTEQFEELPGVGHKTALRLLNEVERSRDASLDRWIIAFGLPGVGKTGAKQLADEFKTLSDLLDAAQRQEALSVLGPATAEQVEAHLSRPEVRAMIARSAEVVHLR